MAIKYDLYKNIGDIDIYIDFEILIVKVIIIFLSTVGFSLLREGYYLGRVSSYSHYTFLFSIFLLYLS